MTRSAGAPVPALVVPDEQTWTMLGSDPASLGVEPVFAPGSVRRVPIHDPLPTALEEPLAHVLDSLPPDVEGTDGWRREHAAHHDHHDHGADHGHGGHDHHDMMAIVGEPSSDGLVMEPLEVRYGPLGTPLPGGLVADVTLDGDVVAKCELTALLSMAAGAEVPDRLAPEAWRVAHAMAQEVARRATVLPTERWHRLARLELERALSHAAWLRSLARLLGWRELVERTATAVSELEEANSLRPDAIRAARDELETLDEFVAGSRRLRLRLGGRARLDADRARELGLRGPIARASGVIDDARSGDPLYRTLGFEPVIRSEGDSLARTLVRVSEAAAAVALAARALEAESGRELSDALPLAAVPPIVEAPRGPVEVRRGDAGWEVAADGQDAALTAAGESVVGSEWATALVGLASFDLSPWRVGA